MRPVHHPILPATGGAPTANPRRPPREHPSPEPGLARKHDEPYKLIFSQRAAVEDLVRGLAGGKLAEELDFHTLEPLPTDLGSDELVRRQADLLSRIRFRGSWLYLLILLEFQSKVDRFMALRILTYICLADEELVRRGEIKAGDKLPPLLPVTVYNGPAARGQGPASTESGEAPGWQGATKGGIAALFARGATQSAVSEWQYV